MKPRPARGHKQLCTIELVAEGHADRCPGEPCPFWDHECALSRVEHELDYRPEIAGVLLELRRELEAGHEIEVAAAQLRLADVLDEPVETS